MIWHVFQAGSHADWDFLTSGNTNRMREQGLTTPAEGQIQQTESLKCQLPVNATSSMQYNNPSSGGVLQHSFVCSESWSKEELWKHPLPLPLP